MFSWTSIILYLKSKRMRIEVCKHVYFTVYLGRKVSVNYLSRRSNYATIAQTVYPLLTPRPFKLFVKTTELSGKVGTCSSQEQYPFSFFRCCFSAYSYVFSAVSDCCCFETKARTTRCSILGLGHVCPHLRGRGHGWLSDSHHTKNIGLRCIILE